MAPTPGELRAIGCTQCGAPLELRGGHKVRSLTCGYCGSVLDTHQEYAVVHRYRNLVRPPSPVALGTRGNVKGVEFTVIGVVQWRARDDGSTWLEYMLFSPTHGYAWLEYDRGHFLFSRRIREVPRIPSARKASFSAAGHTFRRFDGYQAELTFVEGELTWVAEVGDTVTVTDAIAPPFIFTCEETGAEEEYLLGEYLRRDDVVEAFGIDEALPRVHSIHPAQPFEPHPVLQGMHRAALAFAPLCLLFALLIMVFGGGSRLTGGSVSSLLLAKGAMSEPFRVDDADELLRLSMSSPVRNDWLWVTVDVERNGEPVFAMGKEIAYYSGSEGGESWSEGSNSTKAYFKVPESGEYTLAFTGEGGAAGSPRTGVKYQLDGGIVISRYFFVLALLLALVAGVPALRRMRFERRRWGDDDEDDDD